MPTFDTPHPITAVVEIASGAVRLTAEERTRTTVEVRPRDASRSSDVKAAEQVRVDFRSGTLTVRSARGFAIPRRGGVVVDIMLPSQSQLDISIASAQLSADGVYGDCRLASASGDIRLASVLGALRADTASGDVCVHNVTGSATVSTSSGDAVVDELSGDVKMRTASGALNIGRLTGDVNAQTSSGDVTVATAVHGSVSVQTASGEVCVGIAGGTAAKLDLRTGTGSVRNTLQAVDGPEHGDKTLRVHAWTASGDVVVKRAAGPAAA